MSSSEGVPREAYTSMSHEYQASSVIQMRLDTTKLLADVEAYYRGTRVSGFQEREDGTTVPVFEDLGVPRMNQEGIQEMMTWLSILFNPQTVQGNKKSEDFDIFMSNLHADIAEALMVNLVTYKISENDYSGIIDKTLAAADMFFSRTIDNLERESYAATMRSVEKIGEERRSVMDMLPFRNKG